MQIAFYGNVRQIGTSANLAAIKAGLSYYQKIPEEMTFIDCSPQENLEDILKSCDLLVLNLSASNPKLKEVYFRHSFVHKNVIFLIGKYFQNQSYTIKQLVAWYRLPLSRVCVISYNPRFQMAYENGTIMQYLEKNTSWEDMEFHKQLQRTIEAILTHGMKKGEK